MLTGRIRPVETRTEEVTGASLDVVNEMANAQQPAGWELVSCVPSSTSQDSITAIATYAVREPIREVEGTDLDALRAKVPDGWELLSVTSD